MITISLDIPNAVASRVVDAIASEFNYAGKKIGSETKNQFAKRVLVDFLKSTVKRAEGNQAALAARVSVEQAIDADITIN